MKATVRVARTEDIDEIQDVAEKSWHAAHDPIIGKEAVNEFLNEHYQEERLRKIIEDDSVFWVAEYDDDIVGFAMGPRKDEQTFALGAIYVDTDYWGEGIGTQLLKAFEEEVRKRDGERIRLGVMKQNENARRFYESKGFEKAKEEYNEDLEIYDVFYTKDLT